MIEWGVVSVEKNDEFEDVLLRTLKEMTEAGFMYCFETSHKPSGAACEKCVLVVAKPVPKPGEEVRRVVRVPGGGIMPV